MSPKEQITIMPVGNGYWIQPHDIPNIPTRLSDIHVFNSFWPDPENPKAPNVVEWLGRHFEEHSPEEQRAELEEALRPSVIADRILEAQQDSEQEPAWTPEPAWTLCHDDDTGLRRVIAEGARDMVMARLSREHDRKGNCFAVSPDGAIHRLLITDSETRPPWAALQSLPTVTEDDVAETMIAAKNEIERLQHAVDLAWGVIANAGGGDWSTQTEEWCLAAANWRDRYVGGAAAATQPPTPPAETTPLSIGGKRQITADPKTWASADELLSVPTRQTDTTTETKLIQ